jgi:MraZ protein
LYPKDTWAQLVEHLRQTLNPYNMQHNMFLRKFFADTAELTLDANNRLLLPKRLTEQVGITNEVLLIGIGNKIELWNPQDFQDSMISDEQFALLAEQILGNGQNNEL